MGLGFMDFVVLVCLNEFFIIIIFVSQKNIELSPTISTIGSKI